MGASCRAPSLLHGPGAPRGRHGLPGAAFVSGQGGLPRGSPSSAAGEAWGWRSSCCSLGKTHGADFAGPVQFWQPGPALHLASNNVIQKTDSRGLASNSTRTSHVRFYDQTCPRKRPTST